MKNPVVILMLTVLPLLATFSASAREGNASATDRVWQHHVQAWSERDLDGIVSDYSNSSFLIVNGRTYIGQSEIRKVFQRLFQIFSAGKNQIDTPTLRDRIVYITWHFTPRGEAETFGTDTFVIEIGAISVQSIASPLYEIQPEN